MAVPLRVKTLRGDVRNCVPDDEMKKTWKSDDIPGYHNILRNQDDEVVHRKILATDLSNVPLSKTGNEKQKPFTFKPARYSGPGKTLHATYCNACNQACVFS